jgi:hypothetical protein
MVLSHRFFPPKEKFTAKTSPVIGRSAQRIDIAVVFAGYLPRGTYLDQLFSVFPDLRSSANTGSLALLIRAGCRVSVAASREMPGQLRSTGLRDAGGRRRSPIQVIQSALSRYPQTAENPS